MTLIYNTLPPTTDLLVNKQTLWINKPFFLTLEKKQNRMKQNKKWEEKWKEKKNINDQALELH